MTESIPATVPAEKVRAWVERTCAEQGIPVGITDPVTVKRVATLLDGKARRDEPV